MVTYYAVTTVTTRSLRSLRGHYAVRCWHPSQEVWGRAWRRGSTPAASGPGGLLSEQNKFGLVVQDVFTRKIARPALPDKQETVTRAAAEIIPDLVQEVRNNK